MGTQNKSNRELTYCPFAQARAFVRMLALRSGDDWWVWCRAGARPPDIPATPDRVYRDDGWSNWGDWLGTGTVATGHRRHRPFAEARSFVQGLGLRSQADWQAWAKTAARPPDIPAAPAGVYTDCGWLSWGDWLGTGMVAVGQRRYRPFTEARASVRALGLRNCDEGMVPDGGPAARDSDPSACRLQRRWVGRLARLARHGSWA